MSGTVLNAFPLHSQPSMTETAIPFYPEAQAQTTKCPGYKLIPQRGSPGRRPSCRRLPGNRTRPAPSTLAPLPLLRTVALANRRRGGHGYFPLTPSDTNAKAGTSYFPGPLEQLPQVSAQLSVSPCTQPTGCIWGATGAGDPARPLMGLGRRGGASP